MELPAKPALTPPFRITRASHLELAVRDLSRSRDFYTQILGLVVSDGEPGVLYLRGVEERSHHSLILRHTGGAPACIRIGFRTFGEEDLDRAKSFFQQRGVSAEFVEVPYQGRALRTIDATGAPVEFCASMPRVERLDQKFEDLRGAGALRFDHYQVTTPNVMAGAKFYAGLGFRIIDYMVVKDEPMGVFLHMKDTPYDIVLIRRKGPAVHHFAYIVNGINEIIKACDVAGSLGLGDSVEFGPGRHTLGHSYYVYLLDPDGHRVELLPPPFFYGDAEDGPVIQDLTHATHFAESWGLPPRLTWLKKTSRFEGVEMTEPPPGGSEPSLEAHLGLR